MINREITIHDYKIEPSLYPDKGNGLRLVLQITFKEELRIIFSSSIVLMDLIKQVPKDEYPFTTTIIKEGERLEFS